MDKFGKCLVGLGLLFFISIMVVGLFGDVASMSFTPKEKVVSTQQPYVFNESNSISEFVGYSQEEQISTNAMMIFVMIFLISIIEIGGVLNAATAAGKDE